jgi:hypothetical protein
MLRWLENHKAEIIAQRYTVVMFKLNNIKYKFAPSYAGKKISYLEIYKLEPQQDISLPDIKTLVANNKTQQGLINEFEEYLNK